MLNALLENSKSRVTRAGGPAVQNPFVQLLCAETAAAIDEMKLKLHRNFRNLHACADRSEDTAARRAAAIQVSIDRGHRALHAPGRAHVQGDGCCGIMRHAAFRRHPVRSHGGTGAHFNQYEYVGSSWGGVMLGLENKDLMLCVSPRSGAGGRRTADGRRTSEDRLRRTDDGCHERSRSPDLQAPMLKSDPACVIRITIFETHRLPLPLSEVQHFQSADRCPSSVVRRPDEAAQSEDHGARSRGRRAPPLAIRSPWLRCAASSSAAIAAVRRTLRRATWQYRQS